MKWVEQSSWSNIAAGVRIAVVGTCALGWGAGEARALLFKPHMANHALCCGMVGVEGFSVRGSGPVPTSITAGLGEVENLSLAVGGELPGAEWVSRVELVDVKKTDGMAEPEPAKPVGALPPLREENGAVVVHFDVLAGYEVKTPEVFRATPETPIVVPEIPQMLRLISGRTAVVQGFMLPLKLEGGRTTEFLLMRDQALCCFGRVPMLNEWVYVRMPQGTQMVKDLPVTFRGKLTVGEILDDGYLIGIYLMDAESFVPEKS